MINIVLGIHGGIDGDVGGPFFYSRTPKAIASAAPAPADAAAGVKRRESRD